MSWQIVETRGLHIILPQNLSQVKFCQPFNYCNLNLLEPIQFYYHRIQAHRIYFRLNSKLLKGRMGLKIPATGELLQYHCNKNNSLCENAIMDLRLCCDLSWRQPIKGRSNLLDWPHLKGQPKPNNFIDLSSHLTLCKDIILIIILIILYLEYRCICLYVKRKIDLTNQDQLMQLRDQSKEIIVELIFREALLTSVTFKFSRHLWTKQLVLFSVSTPP